MLDSFSSVPDSKLFGRTFGRTKDRSVMSGPTKKSTSATGTAPAPSPITQGSANKTRNMISKSPAGAEAEFSSINRMFAEIDASELDMELKESEQANPKDAEKTGLGLAGAETKPARGKAKVSKGMTKRKDGRRNTTRSA